MSAFWIKSLQRLEDPVGAGFMISAGQNGMAAHRANGRDDLGGIGRDQHGTDARLAGAAPDMDDHRLAVNIGQWLAGQARGAQTGRNEDNRIGHLGVYVPWG